MKIIVLFSILIMSKATYSQKTFDEISCALSVLQGDVGSINTSKKSKFYDVRLIAKSLIEPFFLSGDTCYIMESYFVETGTFHSIIWNKTDTLSYLYTRKQLTSPTSTVFSSTALSLIAQWNISAIRVEEKKYDEISDTIYASRIINSKDEFEIGVVKFRFPAF
jgi:hypothetical protein